MKSFLLFLLCACAFAQTSTVAIVDTGIKDATGAAFSGDFVLTPSSVTPASVSTGPSKITLYVRAGTLSASRTTNTVVALYPGTYSVTKRNSVGVTDTGFLWTVPSSGPVAVWQIESRATAAPTYTFAYSLITGLGTGGLLYGGASGTSLLTAPADGVYGYKYATNVPSLDLVKSVQASDPGCTLAAHIGRIWFDTTTTTTALKFCLNVGGSIGWVTK